NRLAVAVLAPLMLGSLATAGAVVAMAGPAYASPNWSSDWAGPNFCASYHVPYMGHSYDGVAACGNAYPNNYQGQISYNGVEFDSVGFQCYELAARYFYYATGLRPPVTRDASDLAYYIHADYPQYPVYPSGLTGTTDRYTGTLVPGSVISMWSSGDEVGHVAVVTALDLNSNETGTIWVLDENGSASALDSISVQNGTMDFEGLYNQFQWADLQPPGAQPTPGPAYYTYSVVGVPELAEHTGPSTAATVVGWLPDHATIEVVCQTTGSLVVRSDIWDKLVNGSYIPDWYTTTPGIGKYSPPIPVC
ncbi:MAG TPA: CHAP domain-containing protein, partial [Acidimicrobiales bacterium]|nr:CHAP domain-containing protein [Acidimicrobiales bacterium]